MCLLLDLVQDRVILTHLEFIDPEDKVFMNNFFNRIERVLNDVEEQEIDLGQSFSSSYNISLPSLSSRNSSSSALPRQEMAKVVAALRQINNILKV